MQDKVEEYTNGLIEAIRESREYTEFKKASAAIADMPELRAQIAQYRKDVFHLQTDTEESALYDQTAQFYQDHMQFKKNPLVINYLSSELAVCRMMQNIAARVADAVDLELDEVAADIRP